MAGGPPIRRAAPVLFINPRSGDGKATRAGLAERAPDTRIEARGARPALDSGRPAWLRLRLLAAPLRATGASPQPSLVLLAYAAAGIVALFPVTPGGLDIVEATLSGRASAGGGP